MKTCYHCGKLIKGKKEIMHVPPNYLIRLGIDFIKVYHPKCFVAVDAEAARELGSNKTARGEK